MSTQSTLIYRQVAHCLRSLFFLESLTNNEIHLPVPSSYQWCFFPLWPHGTTTYSLQYKRPSHNLTQFSCPILVFLVPDLKALFFLLNPDLYMCPFKTGHTYGMNHRVCTIFFAWLHLLSIMILVVIHIVGGINSTFIKSTEYYSIIWIYYLFFQLYKIVSYLKHMSWRFDTYTLWKDFSHLVNEHIRHLTYLSCVCDNI